MMMRTKIFLLVALVGLAAPLTGIAQSYMSPEDVLQQNDGAFLVPGRARGAAWAVAREAQLSLDRHPTIFRDQWEPVKDDGLPPPTPVVDDAQFMNQPIGSAATPYAGIDPLTARLLARLAQQNSILASTAAGSNAPLSQTGPASVLIVGVMLIATIVTLRRARILERFVREI